MPERAENNQISSSSFSFFSGVWRGWAEMVGGWFREQGGRVMQFNKNQAFIFLFYSLDHKLTMIRTEQIIGLKGLCRHLYFFSYSQVRVNHKIQEIQNPRDQPHTQRKREWHIQHLHAFQIQDQSLDSAPPSPSSPNNRSHIIPSRLTRSILHPPSSAGFLTTHISLCPSVPPVLPPVPNAPASPRPASSCASSRIPKSIQDSPTQHTEYHLPPQQKKSKRKTKPGPGEKRLLISCTATNAAATRGGGYVPRRDRC